MASSFSSATMTKFLTHNLDGRNLLEDRTRCGMPTANVSDDLFLRMMEASHLELASAQKHVLKVLKEEFNLIACSMYSLNLAKSGVVLRGQVGFRYQDYLGFSLDLSSLAGRVLLSGETEFVQSLEEAEGYRDRSLISKYKLTNAIIIPISLRRIEEQAFSVSICLYPKNLVDWEELKPRVDKIRLAIDHIFSSSISYTLHTLREQMIEKAMSVTDHYSFLHKALHTFTAWGFEAGSFFIYDDRADCLRLAATTGLLDKRIRKTDAYYRMNETEHLTVQAYLKEEPKEIGIADITDAAPKFRESTASTFHSSMAFPFFSPSFFDTKLSQKSKCFGILRLANKLVTHDNRNQVLSFSWEDKLLVDYFLNLCSVVIHMFKRVEAKTNEFERVVHSLENNVLTVLGALHNIEEYAKQKIHFPDYISHSLPNSLAFMQSLHEQIRVFKTRDERELPKIDLFRANLFGEVISKLPEYISSVARCYSAPGYGISIEDFTKLVPALSDQGKVTEQAFLQIPHLLTEPELLLTVFKNLVENSIKYSQPAKEAKIRISWCVDGDFVSVRIWDNGIGIPEEDADYIFNETYQAENAMRRRTSGAGIGLYQCRFIMHYLKGSVEYLRNQHDGEYKTCFLVKIPRFGV